MSPRAIMEGVPLALDSSRSPARGRSGRAFIVAVVLFCGAFVAFLIIGSPLLRERTLEHAPPPAPHIVAQGQLGEHRWQATAFDRGAEEPCLRIEIDETTADLVCGDRLGPPIRTLRATELPDEQTIVSGLVDARTATIDIDIALAPAMTVEVVYADFGFPMGFFTAVVDSSAHIDAVTARDRDGAVRDRALCKGTGDGPLGGACEPDPSL